MKYFILVASCILILSNCVDKTKKKGVTKEDTGINYIEEGQKIALTTFGTLSGNLQKAMQEGGVANAVEYCNLAASPLVDSLVKVYNVDIKRTALKVRNPDNRPTNEERVQLEEYQVQHEKGNTLKPVIQKVGNNTLFHAPIFLMPLCQKCHGKIGEELKEEDYTVIQNLYPADKAIDYQAGDLRGMWSITFYWSTDN